MAAGDFVVYRNNANTQTITDGDGTTTDITSWDTLVDSLGSGITHSAGVFTLGETGRFLVMASDQIGTTDTTNNERTSVDFQIVHAGTLLREGAGSGYIRRSGGSQEEIPFVMAFVNVTTTTGNGDEIFFRHTRRDNSTTGTVARIADRSGVAIIKLDDTWNYAHYRTATSFASSATDNVRTTTSLGTTVEEDGTVFSRTGNNITIDTANPVLAILTHQLDYTGSVTGRAEFNQAFSFDGAELTARGWTQVYGPRGTDNANAASMTSATILYPDDTGQVLIGQIISRELGAKDWFGEIQLIELPSSAETATVERTTEAGDANAAGANFAWQTAVNVDTAAFTHTAGNANVDVDNADDYIAIANLGTITDAGWNSGSQRDVPAIGFRVNTTDQEQVGNATYNRMTGTAEHGHMAMATILPGLSANDSVYVRADRIGTNTDTRAAGGGFSLIRRSTLFSVPDGISGVSPSEFNYDETSVVISGAGFDASGNSVYISDASTLAGSANEVDVSSAITAESATSITLNLANLSASVLADLNTLGIGARFIIVDPASGEDSVAVTTHRADEVTMVGGTPFTDGRATTSQLTGGTGTFAAGRSFHTENDGTSTVDIAASGNTEWEHFVEFVTDKAEPGDYVFELRRSDGSVLDTYTQVTTVEAGSGTPTAAPVDIAHAHQLDSPTVSADADAAPVDLDHGHALDSPTVTAAADAAPVEIDHGHTLDSPTVTAIATVTPDDLSHGHELDSPTLSADAAVTPDDLAHGHVLDSPTVSAAADVAPDGLDHAHELDSPTVTITTTVTPDGLDHGHALDSPTVTAAADVAPDGLDHGHTLDSPTVTARADAVPDGLDHAHELDSPTVTSVATVNPDDLAHASTLDSPTVTAAATVTPDGLDHAHELDSPTVAADAAAAPVDLAHGHELDSPTVAAAADAVPDDLAHGSTLDSPTVTAIATAAPVDLAHASTLDSPTVTADADVSPDDLAHAHELDSPTVTTGSTAVPAGLDHAHVLDSPTLTAAADVAPDGLDHGHVLDSPTVTAAADVVPADLDHGHELDSPTVTAAATASPDGLDHGHTLDSPTVTADADVAPDGLDHAHVLDSPTVTTGATAVPDDIDHGHALDSPTVTAAADVVPVDLGHGHVLDSPSVTTGTTAIPDDVDHGHLLDSPSVTADADVSPVDLDHGHLLDAPTVAAAAAAAPDDIDHAHELDSPAVAGTADVAPAGLDHDHLLDSPSVTGAIPASPEVLAHAHQLGAPAVTAAAAAVPVDLDHAHILDSPTVASPDSVTVVAVLLEVLAPTVELEMMAPTVALDVLAPTVDLDMILPS